jgi:hypothetical protein
MEMKMRTVGLLLGLAFAALALTEWQGNLEWSKHDTGAWESYLIPQVSSTYPECLLPGRGRACIMEKAVASARAGDCANAFRLSLLTQGHNSHAQSTIADAGQQAVCSYLK